MSILLGVPVKSSGACKVNIGLSISPPASSEYRLESESNSTNQELPRFVITSSSTDIDLVESPR